MSEASAHGKIILFGEHAAVYGRPALAVGIPDGMKTRSVVPLESGVQLQVSPWDLTADEDSGNLVGVGLRKLLEIVPGGPGGMRVELEARIPPGAGLGSSAAMAVALVRCLARARGVTLGGDRVRGLAHEIEKVFHGRPSGLDDTVATFGGLCLFRRDGWEDGESDKAHRRPITDQAIGLACPLPSLILGDTRVKRSTAGMVAGVRRRWEQDSHRIERLFDRIDGCLQDGLTALEREDPIGLGAAMGRNQQELCELGVSCPEIDQLVDLAGSAGAAGAKLTGAGGGGGVIAVAPGREDEVVEAWRKAGYHAWQVHFDEPGLPAATAREKG